ncbi:hypothetical protein ARAM_002016 [Aspergillus rambellii]|uniref:Amino acid transporter n=1 Tax=Aspergillus rambellii TaxID=308745 RepID=A0A0F8UWK8_9EURO|nr:hypothetical protein ARAM_002016 [Aspergillus rambellii]
MVADDDSPLLRDHERSEYGTLGEGSLVPTAQGGASFNANLGTVEAFGIIISIVIGSGIFTSPGSIDANVPSPGAALVVWLVGGILAWTGAATMAELGTAIPGEGGVQPYLQYIFGDVFGFLAAWTWIIAVVPASLAILSIAFVESIYSAAGITDQSGGVAHKFLAISVLLVVGMANSISTQFSTRLNTAFVTTKFIAIFLIVAAGIIVVLAHISGQHGNPDPQPQDWLTRPWFHSRNLVRSDGTEIDWGKVDGWEMLGHFSTALYGALWAYSGWDKAIYISAELSAPASQLPRAINAALPIIIASFVAVNVAYYIMLPWNAISTTDNVAVTSFTHLFGPQVGIAMAGLICLVMAGSLLGSSFVASRMVVAAANSHWLPKSLASVGGIGLQSHENRDSSPSSASGPLPASSDAPVNAIIFSTTCTIVYIAFGNFRPLMTLNGLAEYTFFFLTMVGALVLRVREPSLHRPYKPLVIIPVVFALVSGFVVIRGAIFAPLQAAVLAVIWLVGFTFHWLRKRWLERQG